MAARVDRSHTPSGNQTRSARHASQFSAAPDSSDGNRRRSQAPSSSSKQYSTSQTRVRQTRSPAPPSRSAAARERVMSPEQLARLLCNVCGQAHEPDTRPHLYDYRSPIDPDFACPLCRQPLVDPLDMTTCSHTFCRVCIQTELRKQNRLPLTAAASRHSHHHRTAEELDGVCPIDGCKIGHHTMQPATNLVRKCASLLSASEFSLSSRTRRLLVHTVYQAYSSAATLLVCLHVRVLQLYAYNTCICICIVMH